MEIQLLNNLFFNIFFLSLTHIGHIIRILKFLWVLHHAALNHRIYRDIDIIRKCNTAKIVCIASYIGIYVQTFCGFSGMLLVLLVKLTKSPHIYNLDHASNSQDELMNLYKYHPGMIFLRFLPEFRFFWAGQGHSCGNPRTGLKIGGSITRPLVLFDPLSCGILSTSMRRGWGGVFHVITEFVMMLVVGLVEGCLSLSEMEPLTVRSPLILPCIVV